MNIYFICVIVHVQMWCVCVLNHMWIKPKRFLFFLFVFGSDLYHPCFSMFFKLFFVWKTYFLGVFVTHFMCKLSWELNGPILKFFSFTQRVSRLFRGYFASKAYQRNSREIPAKFSWEANQRDTSENFQINFLKGISWVICFKCLSSSPKLLFYCFCIKTQLNSNVFNSINISKVIFNSFHWFWSLDYVFGSFMFIVGIFSNGN